MHELIAEAVDVTEELKVQTTSDMTGLISLLWDNKLKSRSILLKSKP